MGIPEEIDNELSLQQAIYLTKERLLPEAEYVFEMAQQSEALLHPLTNTKKKDFPVVKSEECLGYKKKWMALVSAVSKGDAAYSCYTRVIVDNHKFILKYVPHESQAKWEVLFDIEKDLGLNLAFAESELAELSKNDQLSISIIQDGIMLGNVQYGVKQYNHFIPSWMIAEKEELQELYEVVKTLTRGRSVLTIKEKHLHYVDRFKELCTFECYVDFLTCSMSYYYK